MSIPKLQDKDKVTFKPLSTSIQAFQKNFTPLSTTAPSCSLVIGGMTSSSGPSSSSSSIRARPHHLSWEVRALPRLPEDSVTQEETVALPSSSSSSSSSSMMSADEKAKSLVDKTLPLEDVTKEKTLKGVGPADVEEDCGLHSGSISSDTGCSSSSDLSDRSSDEGLDAVTRELDSKQKRGAVGNNSQTETAKEAAGQFGNGSEPETDLIEGALSGPPVSWTGRPRSFSVQSEISLLAQPWNRVCNGSVARAFEKFGTKVESDVSPSCTAHHGSSSSSSSSTSTTATAAAAATGPHRSRRQSTPGPFK